MWKSLRLISISLVAGFAALCAAPSTATSPGTLRGAIVALSHGRDRMSVAVPGVPKPIILAVPNTDLQTRLRPAEPADDVQVVVDDAAKPRVVTALDFLTRPVTKMHVSLALGCAVLLLYGAASAIRRSWNSFQWIVGFDCRYSNSQTQLALWFGAVATVYVATNFLRAFCIGVDFIGGIGLTTYLTALTGLSAFTFGAAKMITVQKTADAQAAQAAQAVPAAQAQQPADPQKPAQAQQPPETPKVDIPTKAAANAPSIKNLVQNDKDKADLGDLQMIMITLAAVTIFLLQSFWWLTDLPISQSVTLPDVDAALLSSFGLGQGAYLFKKAVLPVGQG